MTDRELLDRLRGGDSEAFDAIFREHYAQLVGVADGMLGDRAAAEEIAQEVMLELWRRRESITLEVSLRAYLVRATRNRALNLLRHERIARRSQPHLAPERVAAPTADAELIEREIDAALRQAVRELPARCREVFELSRVHGLRYAEIARTLDISVKTVEAQMGKALRLLRERLAAWLPDGGDL